MRHIAIALAAALAGCSGCAGHKPLDLGNGSLTVTGFSVRGIAAARKEAVEEAQSACEERGEKAVISSFDDHGIDAMLRSTSSVIFRCE